MNDDVAQPSDDRCDLTRFVAAQDRHAIFDAALAELRRGRKETHWMWFIFPQLAGLGISPMAQRYALRNLEEARAFLAHPTLGPRLVECCRALLSVEHRAASEILGHPDDLKLRSSMTLFAQVAGPESCFHAVLAKFYGAVPDPLTLALLRGP